MPGALTLAIERRLLARFPGIRLGGFVAHLDTMPRSASVLDLALLRRAVAARHMVSLGAYDLDALAVTAITLREAVPETDWFVPLGARPTDLPLRDDVIVLAAGSTVLGWGFSLRESRQTCLCARTRRAAFVSETIVDGQAAAAQRALEEVRRRLRDAGARVGPAAFVDGGRPSIELPSARVA
jgi:DNA/RNA-binding domain of Phe-tRNA-synthetase-like protein